MSKDVRQQQLTDWLLAQRGAQCSEPEAIFADASFRRYFRYQRGRHSEIAMDAPPEQEDCRPFIAVTEAYAAAGLPVPAILAQDLELGFMALQDLGDRHIYHEFTSAQPAAWYGKALALLPQIAQVQSTAQGPLPRYDRALLERELALFPEWLLGQHLDALDNAQWQALWPAAAEALIDNALSQPQCGIHRDYHSRNLMVVEGAVALIDYQGALRGPISYDAVSLLRDCYLVLPEAEIERLLAQHVAALKQAGVLADSVTLAQFQRWFDLMGIQRHLKAAGIFARLHHRDGRSAYLADLPRVLNYIITIGARYPETSALATFLASAVLPRLEAVR
ncbi:aminoglycoside phosphotransferase family protein [Ferrimonas pelagia]|uniref:Phosphotransferase n=1 Tax=Ferrimonas pelagia TaxID=1177826 RepID=A0ABP9F6K6_9GAMM